MTFVSDKQSVEAMTTEYPWLRHVSAAMVCITGVALAALSLIFFYPSAPYYHLPYGCELLLAALMLLWLGPGLLGAQERPWHIFLGAGVVLIGAVGLNLIGLSIPWLTLGQYANYRLAALWLLGGIVCLVWATALFRGSRKAAFLWQAAMVPVGVLFLGVWSVYAVAAIAAKQTTLLWISISSIIPCALLVRAQLQSQRKAEGTSSAKPASASSAAAAAADALEAIAPPKTKGPKAPTHFPTRYHELLAKGRFCELFELPCGSPCPLPTKVAMRYQQMRLQHQGSPAVLDALEKAYVALITPRLRELCGVAHDIMQAKAKELGPKRFADREVQLWTTLWHRLQDTELKGDPQKAREARARILREL